MVVPCTELPRALEGLPGSGSSLLFFCDDDDWFTPRLTGVLSEHDFSGADVAVFPWVRLGRGRTCTRVYPPFFPPAAIGPQHPFAFRYQTNNYGLAPAMWRPEHLAAMQDHITASAYGERLRLIDRQIGVIVSASNKTPCAASVLPGVVARDEDFTRAIAHYVRTARAETIPAEVGWIREPLAATIALFSEVLERMPGPT